MCIHPSVIAGSDNEAVDAQCRKLTASWVRSRASQTDSDVETCSFFEEYEKHGTDAVMPAGVYAIDDLKDTGKTENWDARIRVGFMEMAQGHFK